MADETVIEYPATGATYHHEAYGVYRYGTYEDWSVLAGQEKRSSLGTFDTLEEAQAAHPEASWQGEGSCGFREVNIPETAPDWFDEANAGERWTDDY